MVRTIRACVALLFIAFGFAGCASGTSPVSLPSHPSSAKASHPQSPNMICPQSTQIVCCQNDCPTPGPTATPMPVNAGCDSTPNCPITVGRAQYTTSPGQRLMLTNTTGTYIQVSQIQGIESGATNGYGEYGAYLDAFSDLPQSVPGIGQVGYVSKDSGYSYPPITWSDSVEPTALSVPPNHSVYVYYNGNLDNHPWTFIVDTAPQTWGVQSWRQPRGDESRICDGTTQSTTWAPWQNTTGAPLYLRGALIYAANGGPPAPNRVQNAALYILDTSGNVRWSDFSGINTRGNVATPGVQKVYPGEYIAAQAINTCQAPARWDWAAFMYVSTG